MRVNNRRDPYRMGNQYKREMTPTAAWCLGGLFVFWLFWGIVILCGAA